MQAFAGITSLYRKSYYQFGHQKMYFGGAEEDRTPDPLLAKQVLSQLSYSPLKNGMHSARCLACRSASLA